LKHKSSLILDKKEEKREYFLADKIPNSPRGAKCSKIEKKSAISNVCLGGCTTITSKAKINVF